MENDFTAVCGIGVVESVTITVKLNVPKVVGVPEIVPPDPPSVKPVGSVPELMLHKWVVVPPEAASVAVYEAPCCPLGKEVVVMISGVVTRPALK